MASARVAFTLPVPWDRAVVALERAIDQGRTRLELIDRGNGYWHLRTGGTTVHIEFRIQSPTTTHIWLVAKRHGLGALTGSRPESLLRTVREDIEHAIAA